MKTSLEEINEVERNQYLGSVFSDEWMNGGFEEDILHKIKFEWIKCNEALTILCKKNISIITAGFDW